MKVILVLSITAAIFFTIACGNNSDTSSVNSDTSTTINDSTATHNSTAEPTSMPHQDTAKQEDGLMNAVNTMMDKMHSMQMTGDFDVDFATMMAEHHQGGIDMAQYEISQGKDQKMKAKAQEIITKQKDEQQKLRDFVSTYKPSGMKHGEGDLQKSMQMMMDKMKSMQMTGNTDKDFATMMISHHEDGISMGKMEVTNGMSGKLKEMARKSTADQQKDIKEFQSWLSANK